MTEPALFSARNMIKMAMAYSASGGSLLAAAGAQLITFAIVARSLGAEQFGIYVVITAITSIAVTVSGLGGQESLVRRVARDPSSYATMLGHVLLLLAVSGTLLVGVGLLTLPFLLPLDADPATNLLSYAFVLVANLVLYRFIVLAGQSFVAVSRFAPANAIEIWYAVVRLGAAALGCLVFQVDTVAGWATWLFGSHLLVALTCAISLRGFDRPQFRIVREEIPLGLFYCSQFVVRTLRQNADLLVLGVVASPEIIGSYGIARRMLDSSYLSVEALNRLVYPGSAAASVAGLHAIKDRTRNVLFASIAVGVLAAVAMFVLAPVLPIIFGEDYTSVVYFARVLCWAIVPFAMYAVALDALGASGRQGTRALVLNSVNGVGALLIAAATWLAGINGTFVTFYATEVAMVAFSGMAFIAHMRADRARSPSTASLA